MSTFRDAVVAHELAHYVLDHDTPLPGDSSEEMKRAYQERELDANAKAVEILARVDGMSEARALKTIYAYLLGVHWTLERYPRLNLAGHKPPLRGDCRSAHALPGPPRVDDVARVRAGGVARCGGQIGSRPAGRPARPAAVQVSVLIGVRGAA